MLAGLDTGFFYALEDAHPTAMAIWREREMVTSAIVLYEIQKKLLQGDFGEWPTLVRDIRASLDIVSLTPDIALKAGHLAHGTGMPGLDALILSSLLEVECNEIYTTDAHLELYKKEGLKIVNLDKSPRLPQS